MKRFLTLIFALVLAACDPVQELEELDLTPLPHATAADPEWIRKFDAAAINISIDALAKHKGSLDSHVILWEELNCLNGVYVAQARAAQALSEWKGISLGAAKAEAQSDPMWTIAKQGCHQPYRGG